MSIRLVLVAALVLLVAAPNDAVAAKPKGNATFSHPWMPQREIGYQHDSFYVRADKDLDVLFTDYFERHELAADGSTTMTLRWTLRTKDDGRLPRYLHVATKSSALNTRVEYFRAVLKTSRGVEKIGEDRLIEIGADAFQSYVGGYRRLILMLPERKTGTLEFEVRVVQDADPEVEGYFGGIQVLQVGAAVSQRVLEIAVPEGTPLQFEKRYFEAPMSEATDHGVTTHRLAVNYLYPLWWSPGMPHFADAYPSLTWSNQKDWSDFGRRMSKPWGSKLQVSEAAAAKARDLASGSTSIRDTALAIHDYVADGWTYLGFYPGESGWVPHEVKDVWDFRIGDCKDQTALMVVMLRAAGVEAYPAIGWAGTGGQFESTKVPVVLANHAFVFVVDPDHPASGFFLNSTDVGFAASPQGPWMGGRDAVVFFEGDREPTLVSIPPATSEQRTVTDNTRLELQSDGSVRALITRIHQGDKAASAYREWRDSGPAERERELRADLESMLPGAVVESMSEGPDPDGWGRWRLDIVATVPGWVNVTGEIRTVTMPWARRYGAAPKSAWGDRSHPRQLIGFLRDQNFEVVLPEGTGLVSIPDSGEHEWQNWKATFDSAPQGRTVTIRLRASERPGRMFRRDEERRKDFYRWVSEVQEGTVVYRQEEAE